MSQLTLSIAVWLVFCALPACAWAEMYRWTDANGRLHITDDLSQVPPDQRPGAEVEPEGPAASRWNAVDIRPPSAPGLRTVPRAGQPRSASPAEKGRTHVLFTPRAGREIRLSAKLNGATTAAFIADTGAMLNTIPLAAVRELGIDLRGAPTITLSGVGGRPIEAPLVTLRSVQVGTATVENVEMAVLNTMSTGLLGMPFFNNFKVAYDPTQGTLTLEEVDLSAIEGVYGGYDETTWRAKFSHLHRRLDWVEEMREAVPSGRRAHHEWLDQEQARVEGQLDRLQGQATRSGVPRAWR